MQLDHHRDEVDVEDQQARTDDGNVTDSNGQDDHENQLDLSMEVDEVKAEVDKVRDRPDESPIQDVHRDGEPQDLPGGTLFSPAPNNHSVYHIFDEGNDSFGGSSMKTVEVFAGQQMLIPFP